MLRNPWYRSACSGASLHTSCFNIRSLAVAAVTVFEARIEGAEAMLEDEFITSAHN
jgi:hypothetical protein